MSIQDALFNQGFIFLFVTMILGFAAGMYSDGYIGGESRALKAILWVSASLSMVICFASFLLANWTGVTQ